MRFYLRDPRKYELVALLGLSACIAGAASAGEIFRCVAKDGTPLYQNFPCSIESMGFDPSTPTATSQAHDKSGASANAASAKSSKSSDIRVGMTTEEVTAVMGQPVEMVEDEPAVGGRVSNWRFADGRIVQFDHTHRVLGVQR